jgi:alcohol dehydrogenase
MINNILSITFPGKLVFGNGCINQLAAEIINLNPAKVFILSSTTALQNIKQFIAELKGIELLIDHSIKHEPTDADFNRILEKAKPFNPEIIIGVGGGSVLDIAKLIAAQLNNNQQLSEYIGIGLLKSRSTKLICIPTTSGSGSEVSPNAVIIDTADGQKKAVISPYLVPDIVYIDPMLSITLPSATTAATGMDALTHCIEAYTNKNSKPLIDIYALEGIRLIAANIQTAVHDGANIQARENVAMGSMLGGLCLGPVNTAGVHALSYPLGIMFHLAHGLSNAMLLPYVMEFNIPAHTTKYANIAIVIGCTQLATELETAYSGVQKIKEINKAVGIPSSLAQLNVPATAIEKMAKDAMKVQRLLKNNPREITEKDAIEIYKAAI